MQKKSIKFKKSILSLIILAIFLAPISASLKVNKNGNLNTKIEITKTQAQNTDENLIVTPKDTSVIVDVYVNSAARLKNDTSYTLSIFLFDGDKISNKENVPADGIEYIKLESQDKIKIGNNDNNQITKTFTNLTPKHNYQLLIILTKESFWTDAASLLYKTPNAYVIPLNLVREILDIDLAKEEIPYRVIKNFSTKSTATANDETIGATINQTPEDFQCAITNLPGCLLQLLYSLWQASAWVATLAGGFLDFFIYYSTNSASYDNMFVKQAWAAVRDIANIFFIIALLFIAVKTVLGLNVSDNKKLVGTVIVIALVINFSLFTSQLVIDGSNILAKVFYNNISSVDEKGNKTEDTNSGGQKSISVGLVQKFNPQNIVMDAYDYGNGLGIGYVIFIIILLMAITLYTAYIFFSVALLFVARVVSLWISMIFSPMAFASYTVPFDIPGFGHKEWWSDLLKNAFLAPLFIFMLYIIVLFAGFLTEIAKYTSDQSVMQRLMSIIIPFIILMVLLRKSKELAVKYSGELGAAINKFGGTIAGIAGGVVGGAVIGTVAAAGQATLGHAGKKLFESDKLAEMEASTDKGLAGWSKRFVGRNLRTIGGGDDGKGGMAGSSFDARKGIVGGGLGLLSKATGLNMGGQSKFLMKESGGYEADLKRKHEKRLKRAEGLKTKEGEEAKQTLNRYEEEHQDVSIKNENAIHEKDLAITGAKAKRDSQKVYADSIVDKKSDEYKVEQAKLNKLADEVRRLEGEKSAIKNGGMLDKNGHDGTGKYRTHNGNITKEAWEDANKKAEEAGKSLVETGIIKSDAEKANAAAVTEKVAAIDELNRATAARIEAEAKANSKPTIGDPAVIAKTLADAKKAEEDAKNRMSIATNNVDITLETLENANKKLEKAKETISTAEKANKAKTYADTHGGFGNSQNDYEDHLLPHQKHKVAAISRERARGLATDIAGKNWQFWNKDARMKSAHDIRMGVKVENHGGGKGGHGGGMVGHIISDAIANKITNSGGGEQHEHTATAPSEPQGGGGKNAHTTEHHG